MKKVILSLFAALLATVSVDAQQIAVVSKGGTTTICQTLKEAIETASSENECVIYLPGGGFPIADDVKITKKMTIIGIGHNGASENADGRTLISGHLFFEGGSDGSSVMGCYINGNVYIGTAETPVHGIMVKYCNLNSVQVQNADCLETLVNQNFIRGGSNYGNAKVTITNNIMNGIYQVKGGTIAYNITQGWCVAPGYSNGYGFVFLDCTDCTIDKNVIMSTYNNYSTSYIHRGSNCQATGNMLYNGSWGDECISNSAKDWGAVFEKHAGINPVSKYHFKEEFKENEGKVGIYAGGGFSETTLPPVPYIFKKDIPDKTDASGKLHINIAVKAGGTE